MMRTLFIPVFLLLALYSTMGHAQGENYRWHFGQKQSINFNSNPPLQEESNILTYESSVSVSDTSGHLLFYTMGSRIWNRDGVEMANSNGLLGNGPLVSGYPFGSSAYGTQVVRHPGNTARYIVFSGDALEDNSFRIHYSVVDMTLDNGKGAVVSGQKNILLTDNASEYMMIAKGADCKSFWLVVRSRDVLTRNFLSFRIDAGGVSNTPTVTNPPPVARGNALPMVLAKDGTLYSLGQELVIARFNTLTGEVYDFRSIAAPTPGYLCLSPDQSKLYLSNPTAGIRQYDLDLMPDANAMAVAAQTVSPPSPPGTNTQYLDMRNGPDRKLYVLKRATINNAATQFIDRLNTPDLPAVGYSGNIFNMDMPWSPQINVFWGLGEDVVISTGKDTIMNSVKDTVVCLADALLLKAYDQYAGSYQWGNGGTGKEKFVYEDGTYWVYSTDECRTLIDSFHVDFVRFELDLPDEISICPGQTIILNVNHPMIDQYVWNDGSRDNMIEVRKPGQYYVTATSGKCMLSDTVMVHQLQPQVDILNSDTSMCISRLEPITAVASLPGTFTWSNGASGAEMMPDHTGKYVVTHTNVCGTNTDSVYITLNNCICNVMVPNAFTPNGDGRNDVFSPVAAPGCNFMFYEMRIVNRYGQYVYYTNNEQQGWDGYIQSQPAAAGVYMYSIKYTDRYTHEYKELKGELVLLR